MSDLTEFYKILKSKGVDEDLLLNTLAEIGLRKIERVEDLLTSIDKKLTKLVASTDIAWDNCGEPTDESSIKITYI